MTEKLKQTIKEELLKLPRETQGAINGVDWVKIAEEIGKKYLFDESKISNFQVETLLVLVGLEDGDLYPQNIENNAGIGKDEAIKIANEAFEKIFTPIKNIIEDNIKKNLKNKNHWQQNLDFIMSGGDYSAFVEKRDIPTPATADTQETNIPINKKKITDIKSKFTI